MNEDEKVKWLKLNIRLEFETAVRRLSLDSFTEDKGKGLFLIKYAMILQVGVLSSVLFTMTKYQALTEVKLPLKESSIALQILAWL
ncbi:hypothetical protein BANRA_01545 [Klebsiella pneumoniae]|nr:hypothetical protein BANRA_01545 [Klebsiella pneumoniae]